MEVLQLRNPESVGVLLAISGVGVLISQIDLLWLHVVELHSIGIHRRDLRNSGRDLFITILRDRQRPNGLAAIYLVAVHIAGAERDQHHEADHDDDCRRRASAARGGRGGAGGWR